VISPSMQPRVMRTGAGLRATTPQPAPMARPPTAYDPGAQRANPTPGPGVSRLGAAGPGFGPLPTQTSGGLPSQGAQQDSLSGLNGGPGQRAAVGSSYDAGTGRPMMVGGGVAASAQAPARWGDTPYQGGVVQPQQRVQWMGSPTAGFKAAMPSTFSGPVNPPSFQALMQRAQGAAQQQGGGTATSSSGLAPGTSTGSSASGLAAAGTPAAENGRDTGGQGVTPDGLTKEQAEYLNRKYWGGEQHYHAGDTAPHQGASDFTRNSEYVHDYGLAGQADPNHFGSSSWTEEQRAHAAALMNSKGYIVDPNSGDVFKLDGEGHFDESSKVGNVLTGDLTGGAAGVVGNYDKANGGAGPKTPAEYLQSIFGEDWASKVPQVDQAAVNAEIAASQAQTQYATSQANQVALNSRSRLGAGGMTGITSENAIQGGLQGAKTAADLRMQAQSQNFQAQMDYFDRQIQALQSMAGFADNAEARKAAQALELMREQAQQQMAVLERQQALYGMIGGGIGSLLGIGFNRLIK